VVHNRREQYNYCSCTSDKSQETRTVGAKQYDTYKKHRRCMYDEKALKCSCIACCVHSNRNLVLVLLDSLPAFSLVTLALTQHNLYLLFVKIKVGYETQHSKIGRCSDQVVVDCSIDESLPCWSDSLSRRYRMGLALHVILRLDQEDCILGRGLTLFDAMPNEFDANDYKVYVFMFVEEHLELSFNRLPARKIGSWQVSVLSGHKRDVSPQSPTVVGSAPTSIKKEAKFRLRTNIGEFGPTRLEDQLPRLYLRAS
jgi:hypothetical protein